MPCAGFLLVGARGVESIINLATELWTQNTTAHACRLREVRPGCRAVLQEYSRDKGAKT